MDDKVFPQYSFLISFLENKPENSGEIFNKQYMKMFPIKFRFAAFKKYIYFKSALISRFDCLVEHKLIKPLALQLIEKPLVATELAT